MERFICFLDDIDRSQGADGSSRHMRPLQAPRLADCDDGAARLHQILSFAELPSACLLS